MSLQETARAIVAGGKGILAADESTPTCTKRFESLGLASTDDSRRDYRQTLFTTPGIETSLGGVILFDETFYQRTKEGTPLPDLLAKRGIAPGIKVDTGAKDLALTGEKVTEGLDGLRERLAAYAEAGAVFAKWRAVITIDTERGWPTAGCVEANAHALARYAALCQEAGIVPVVEPEVLMDGPHTIEDCDRITRNVWQHTFWHLAQQNVDLSGILLKPSMIISGKDAKKRATPDEVARRTFAALLDCVPASVPGIVFLSGGQSPEEATEHLRIMNTFGPKPWALSFSYGRALQEPALAAFAAGDVAKAQQVLQERCDANHAAARGKKFVAA